MKAFTRPLQQQADQNFSMDQGETNEIPTLVAVGNWWILGGGDSVCFRDMWIVMTQ